MASRRLQSIRSIYLTIEIRSIYNHLGSLRSYSNGAMSGPKWQSFPSWPQKDLSFLLWNHRRKVFEVSCRSISSCLYTRPNTLPWTSEGQKTHRSTVLSVYARLAMTQAKAPGQARQTGAFKVSMLSPGIIYEPYTTRQPISFWQRWFTRNGWRRTKEDIMLELKSAYAIAKLRKSGYTKQKFYKEAVELYREINTSLANADKTSLRKSVTENMYSALKNEIKNREQRWSRVYWELIEPIVKIRTLRARMIGVDRNDLSKVFIQLTIEFLSKQRFEAYDSEGVVVAGDKKKEVLVRDIWVFEKSLFHDGAHWRLCGRITLQPSKA